MKHLYFLRHGLSEANKANIWSGSLDVALAPEGHEQAKASAAIAREQGLSFDVIISSPLQRAHHTAQYMAEAIGYPIDKIQIHADLVERDFGVLEGRQDPEITRKYIEDEMILESIDGAERLVDLQWRAQKVLDYLHSLPYDSILVVGHGNFARALRRAVNKEPLHERGERFEHAKIIKLL